MTLIVMQCSGLCLVTFSCFFCSPLLLFFNKSLLEFRVMSVIMFRNHLVDLEVVAVHD